MAGARGENFYYNDKEIQVISELAKNLQEYSTNYEEALHYAEMAIERKPRWVTPQRIKAMTLLKLGHVDLADSIIEDALAIKEFPDGYLTKGDIMKARGEWLEAERYYQKALNMNRESTEAKMSVAQALIENMEVEGEGRFRQAELL